MVARRLLASHNHPCANQAVNTDTIDIPLAKIGNIKISLKHIPESKIKNTILIAPNNKFHKIKTQISN